MAKNITIGGRYFDKETGEYILIEDIDNIIVYVFESDGETDTWDIKDIDTFARSLVPANEIAVMAERVLDVKVKKLHPDAIIPEYKTLGAAGFDLSTVEDVYIPARSDTLQHDNSAIVRTGLAFEIPLGYEMEIRGRSGNAFNLRVFAFNGTIDSDYRGEVKILLINNGPNPVSFKKGDRIAQGVIKRIEQVNFIEVDELSETERGQGGFGHTGK